MERTLTMTALFAALIAVLATVPQIHLPFGVPITMQTLGVMLCGAVLGAKRGALAVLLYLVVGALGLPIFAGGRGGLAPFVGPSAGFLIGYPVGAFVIGLILAHWRAHVGAVTFAASVTGGIGVVYVFGITGFWLLAPSATTWWGAAGIMAVFLPGDLVKAALAALIVQALAKARPTALLSRG
ncbi:biotin transporter BioY [Falsirhodobacter halotolerans]|uniref:biotin transporter BioY n=1 Tax=Falsirhodobacter halotolerans TaxID=1146892 RepID=UPI001FD18D46|nr:biotin transporter BioY [Falsirhodobacter halotolerans]MCJ8138854.1 biotin transporter BioY [Falsirhodobacter halotolerans]